MNDVILVRTKGELERALKNKAQMIAIKDARLASRVRVVKSASMGAIVASTGALGLLATTFWNAAGLTMGFIGAVSTTTLTTAILTIGLSTTLIFAIYSDYSIKGKTKVELAGGNSIEADLVMGRDSQ
ncbi:hypothetical protein [Idiomarina sp.]|uniref:hypothetical protein n=1 Tax=Idiomarina sp. TaxID=1874361 RepID=UPI002583895D|nr:hypothetical protein [Idiomarina sp.]